MIEAQRTLGEAVLLGLVDDRTFEQKFGPRCPFCNRTWDDRNSCAPVDPGWSWREQMNASFKNRRPREAPPRSTRICVRCLAQYEGVAGQMYCGKRCLDQVKSQRYRDSRAVDRECAHCGAEYTGKPASSFCSLACANRGRHQAMAQPGREDYAA